MQILSTRFKVSSRRLYESITSNKQYKSYVCKITSPSSDEFHGKHQGLFLFTFLRTQEFVVLLRQYKPPIDPYLEDKHAHLDTDSDQGHLDLVQSFLDIDLHWVLKNDLRI